MAFVPEVRHEVQNEEHGAEGRGRWLERRTFVVYSPNNCGHDDKTSCVLRWREFILPACRMIPLCAPMTEIHTFGPLVRPRKPLRFLNLKI